MIASLTDLSVSSRDDYFRLPPDARWEVADGSAILMPAPKFWHQELGDELGSDLRQQIKRAGRGYVATGVAVFVPTPPGALTKIQCRVPDIVVSTRRVSQEYEAGNPPDWVIEILSTRRGNVERTEKMDDYARAGIGEYWLVNAIDREVEIYVLSAGDYVLVRKTQQPESISFPGVAVDMTPYWPDAADFD